MKKKLALIMAMMLIPASLMGCGQSAAAPEAAESAATEESGAYVFLDEDLGVESYAIGFRIGDEELAETVNDLFWSAAGYCADTDWDKWFEFIE